MKRFIATVCLLFTLLPGMAPAREFLVFFGSYTGPRSKGIYVSRFDSATGKLDAPVCTVQHVGASVNKQRQEGPHAHCANLSPDGRFALACDLGLDKVMIYRLGAGEHSLTANDPAFGALAPGSGPRHLAFSRN